MNEMAQSLLAPVSAAAPCGEYLEYDPEYTILQARLIPKSEVQYGNFIAKPVQPDWVEIERDCRRLLLRSKDISLFVWLIRCRVHLAQANGLVDSLTTLAQALTIFADDIHPQLTIDGEQDPAIRANALAALVDPEGILADIRSIIVIDDAMGRLTVGDIDKRYTAMATVSEAEREQLDQQLRAVSQQPNNKLPALGEAYEAAQTIVAWNADYLGEHAVDIKALANVLSWFAPSRWQPADAAADDEDDAEDAPPLTIEDTNMKKHAATMQRDQAKEHISLARQWFEQNEPSSPVAVLLKQAERMVGKRFAEVAQAIPADLLQRWDQE